MLDLPASAAEEGAHGVSQPSLPGVDTSRPHSEDLEQWFTQPELAARFVEWAHIAPSDRVLEPTAGDGALARAVVRRYPEFDDIGEHLTLVEIDRHFAELLASDLELAGAHVFGADFLSWYPPGNEPVDVALLNPPFGLATEILEHALTMSRRAVALLPSSVKHSGDRAPFWTRHAITREVAFADRPRFIGPKNISPATDFLALELVRLTDAELAAGTRPLCRMEAPWRL
jgi:predicted RNA methylase